MSALHDDTITAGTVARAQAGDASAITAIYQRKRESSAPWGGW